MKVYREQQPEQNTKNNGIVLQGAPFSNQTKFDNNSPSLVSRAIHTSRMKEPVDLVQHYYDKFLEVYYMEKIVTNAKIYRLQKMLYELIIDDRLSEDEKEQLRESFTLLIRTVGRTNGNILQKIYMDLMSSVENNLTLSWREKVKKLELIREHVSKDDSFNHLEEVQGRQYKIYKLVEEAIERVKTASRGVKPE